MNRRSIGGHIVFYHGRPTPCVGFHTHKAALHVAATKNKVTGHKAWYVAVERSHFVLREEG